MDELIQISRGDLQKLLHNGCGFYSIDVNLDCGESVHIERGDVDDVLVFDDEDDEPLTNYIFGLIEDGKGQIDQTSLDENNVELAWDIMVTDMKREPKGLKVELIDTYPDYETQDERFFDISFDNDDHLEDLQKSIKNDELTCLVDEKKGGIIGYVLPSFNLEKFIEDNKNE